MQAQRLGWEAAQQRGQHKQRLCDSSVWLRPTVLASEEAGGGVGGGSEPHRVMVRNSGLRLESLKKVLARSGLGHCTYILQRD